MNKRRMYSIGLTTLLLGVMVTTYGVWTQSNFSHGEPSFDQGCYCHNNGIAIFVNATGDGQGGTFFGPFAAGSSFHLYISTNNVAATGVVPGLQQWQSNQTDNAKFNISPMQVTDGSAQDRSATVGNITALYKMTAPTTAGFYTLTLYAQGSLMQGIVIQVTGGSTSTSSTTSSTTSTASTPSSTSPAGSNRSYSVRELGPPPQSSELTLTTRHPRVPATAISSDARCPAGGAGAAASPRPASRPRCSARCTPGTAAR